MKNKKKLEALAETIIGKIENLKGQAGWSPSLQEASRLVRKFIDNELK
jgi:hypothetical protein